MNWRISCIGIIKYKEIIEEIRSKIERNYKLTDRREYKKNSEKNQIAPLKA